MPDDDHRLAAAGDRGTDVIHGRSGREPLVGLHFGAGGLRNCFTGLSGSEQRTGDDRVGLDPVGAEPLSELFGLSPPSGVSALIRLAGSGLGMADEIEPHAGST